MSDRSPPTAPPSADAPAWDAERARHRRRFAERMEADPSNVPLPLWWEAAQATASTPVQAAFVRAAAAAAAGRGAWDDVLRDLAEEPTATTLGGFSGACALGALLLCAPQPVLMSLRDHGFLGAETRMVFSLVPFADPREPNTILPPNEDLWCTAVFGDVSQRISLVLKNEPDRLKGIGVARPNSSSAPGAAVPLHAASVWDDPSHPPRPTDRAPTALVLDTVACAATPAQWQRLSATLTRTDSVPSEHLSALTILTGRDDTAEKALAEWLSDRRPDTTLSRATTEPMMWAVPEMLTERLLSGGRTAIAHTRLVRALTKEVWALFGTDGWHNPRATDTAPDRIGMIDPKSALSSGLSGLPEDWTRLTEVPVPAPDACPSDADAVVGLAALRPHHIRRTKSVLNTPRICQAMAVTALRAVTSDDEVPARARAVLEHLKKNRALLPSRSRRTRAAAEPASSDRRAREALIAWWLAVRTWADPLTRLATWDTTAAVIHAAAQSAEGADAIRHTSLLLHAHANRILRDWPQTCPNLPLPQPLEDLRAHNAAHGVKNLPPPLYDALLLSAPVLADAARSVQAGAAVGALSQNTTRRRM